ncbi:hypothetical protein PACILC2_12260 [Paenibacillus cisolokensis]|uniref:Uncharacterized protein n=1 Tax=Paenibacillus cisolokensis TaxID=1658519 RepID=A0ABQ4N3D1_9BACL|nr:hypothetical protein [Paenibacillus cisolokensis]GIQ62658.1 hypothetical protein PACILC2_12260 [Paenibacillus cisolokensis]
MAKTDAVRTITISQRLIIIIGFFICFPVMVIGWYWYRSSTETIEAAAIATYSRIVGQTNAYLDLYISNLENSTFPFVNHPQIQQFISRPSFTPYQYFHIAETMERELFSQTVYGRTDIVGLSVVASNNWQITDFTQAKGWIDMSVIRERNKMFCRKWTNGTTFRYLDRDASARRPC